MNEYIFLFIIVVICAYYNKRMRTNMRIFCVVSICLYIVFLFGFRYKVGVDTFNYMDSYSNAPSLYEFSNIEWSESRFEPGYLLISMICKTVTSSFWLVQLIMAGITNVCILTFIYRQCRNPFVGIIVYFILAMFYYSTEIMRESAAIGIFLLNFKNLQRERIKRYYAFCLLSIMFHYSAIITLLFPLVRLLKINIVYILVCTCCVLIAPLVETLNQLLTIPTIAYRIDAYVLQAQGVNLNFRLFFLIYLLTPALCAILFAYKKIKNQLITKFVLLHIVFCCGVFAIPIIFSRFANFTTPFVIIMIANLLSGHHLKRAIRMVVFVITFSSQSLYYAQMFYAWVPYVSIFNPILVEERENTWWEQAGQYRN